MTARSVYDAVEGSQAVSPAAFPARKRVTRWVKASYIGAVTGALFLTVEMFLLEAFGRGHFWEPLRLSASIAMGSEVTELSAPFTFDVFFVGVLVHFLITIWYVSVLGMIIRKLKTGPALAAGAGFGVLLYLLHFYGLSALYPWVAGARDWTMIVTHVVFGVSTAWMYTHLHVRHLMHEQGLSVGAS